MANATKDIGPVSAYALAVEHGFIGTEEEWATLQMQSGVNAQRAEDAANESETSAQTAGTHAHNANNSAQEAQAAQSDAENSKNNAAASENNAKTSADAALNSASAAKASADAANASATSSDAAANRAETAAADAESAMGTIASLINAKYAGAIIKEANGEIISVNDSSDNLLAGLRVFGKTVQDGVPSPDAPVEPVNAGVEGSIGVTVCGKNLLNLTIPTYTRSGVTGTNNGDGTFTFTGTTPDGKFSVSDSQELSLPAGAYELSGAGSGSTCVFMVRTFDSAGNTRMTHVGDGSFTITDEDSRVTILAQVWPNQTTGLTLSPMIRRADAADASFEPYAGGGVSLSVPGGLPGIPVSSGGNYTDESGQMWLCDEVDFEKGVYIKRVGAKRGAELTWSINTTWSDTNGSGIFGFARITDMKNGVLLSNTFKQREFTTSAARWSVGEMSIEKDTVLYALISNAVEATPAAFAAYMSEIDAVFMYQLITPVETPLPAEAIAAYRELRSHKPITTAFNDASAGLELTYAADTKLYIDNRFAELAAAIISTGGNV